MYASLISHRWRRGGLLTSAALTVFHMHAAYADTAAQATAHTQQKATSAPQGGTVVKPGAVSGSAKVVTALQSAAAPSLAAGEAVIVTGTNRSRVTQLKSATPISIVTAERLSQTGAATLGQALEMSSPSVNFPANRANTSATATKQVSLRGLSPDETLVLVNGHRWYPSASVNTGDSFGRGSQAVDLAAIPISAIDHIEVLSDGASAQYGSDAVAGVINIVLRNTDKGGAVGGQAGVYSSGYGFTSQASWWKGFALPHKGKLTISGTYDHHDFVPLNSGTDTRCYYCATSSYPTAHPEKEASAPGRNWQTGMGEGYDLALAATLDQPITDKLDFYGLFNYSQRETAGVSPLRLPNANTNVVGLTPDGYQLRGWGRPQDIAGMAGLKYKSSIGLFDLGFTFGQNKLSMYTTNSENPSYGLNSPRNFYLGRLTDQMKNLELNYKKSFKNNIFASPITVSAGFAQRWENYFQDAGDVASYSFGGVSGVPIGVTGGGYITPEAAAYNRGRSATSGFVGVEADPVKKLTVSLAGRVEGYSDFGTAITGKASARYEVNRFLAFRASVNNAFKAPTIGQLSLFQDTPVQVTPSAAYPSGRAETLLVPSDSAIGQAAGGRALKPEKSINISGGTVVTINRHAWFTLDGYYLKIRNRIALSNIISGSKVSSVLSAAGYPTVYGIQYFLNMGSTTTTGLDFSGHYDVRVGRGNFVLSGGISYNHTKLDNVTDASLGGSPLVDYYHVTSLFYQATPKIKTIFNETYSIDRWRFTATQTYYGSYGGANNQNPGTQAWFEPLVTADFTVSYAAKGGWDVLIGVQNAANAKPKMVYNSGNGGRLSNSSLAVINPSGSFAYGSVSKTF